MPEHIRSLIVILLLALIAFYLANNSKYIQLNQENFKQRRNLWLFLTFSAFISSSFWVYAVVTIIALLHVGKKESNPLALFFFLLFLIPPAPVQIPGFGLINYFIELNHVRLLSLLVLFPLFIKIQSQKNTLRFGSIFADKVLSLYLVLIAILFLSRMDSATNATREIFYLLVDVLLPYYTFSRAITNRKEFNEVFSAYVIITLVLALVGAFESSRHWLLYKPLLGAMGIDWDYATYLGRAGILRASASTGQAIALGYVMVISIGFYLSTKNYESQRLSDRFLPWILLIGVIAPLSRGPWLGLVVLATVFTLTGKKAVSKFVTLITSCVIGSAVFAMTVGSQRFMDFLPFVGNVETGTIDYRQRLIDNSILVIQRNPFFGSPDFLKTPEMQEMIQGQGIIDVTNTYLAIALSYGFVGLALFLTFFLATAFSIYRLLKKVRHDEELHLIGRGLLSVIMAILVILVTVSSITIIPVVYWSIAGMGVAYISMAKQFLASAQQGLTKSPDWAIGKGAQ